MKPSTLWPRLEYGFTVLALFFYSTNILELVLSRGTIQQNEIIQVPAAPIQITFVVTYLVFGGLALGRWQTVLRSLRGDVVLLPLLAVAYLSFLWSDAPTLTLRRLVALLGTSLVGIYLANRYSLRQQLRLLGWVLGLVVVASYAFVLVWPSYGVMAEPHEGAWRGVFTHKNGLGMKMALSALVFVLLALGERQWRWLWGLGLVASLGLLLPAKSSTGIGTLVLVLLSLLIYRLLPRRGGIQLTWKSLAVVAAVSIPVVYLGLNVGRLLQLLGKDSPMSGRPLIWGFLGGAIAQRPLLGYGYEAYWGVSGSQEAVYRATDILGATHAHNGVLQLWLSLGLVGVVVFLCGLWLNLRRSLVYLRHNTGVERYWPIALITLLVLINFPESNILEYNDIVWVLYCALTLTLARRFVK